MPFITWFRTLTTKLVSKSLAELEAPLPDSFITHLYTPPGHHYFDLTIAERKVEIQPDAFLNNLGWIAMSLIRRGRLYFVRSSRFDFQWERCSHCSKVNRKNY